MRNARPSTSLKSVKSLAQNQCGPGAGSFATPISSGMAAVAAWAASVRAQASNMDRMCMSTAPLEAVAEIQTVHSRTSEVALDQPEQAAVVDVAGQVEGLHDVLLVGEIGHEEPRAPLLARREPRGRRVRDRVAVLGRRREVREREEVLRAVGRIGLQREVPGADRKLIAREA